MTAKQTVIVKKSPTTDTLAKATKMARKYADRIYTHRETSTSYRFRQRDDDDFKKDTFKTEVKTNLVSIVWGELKEVDKKTSKVKKSVMPIPKPKPEEEHKDFIPRCMNALVDEYPEDKQRAAICYNTWREEKGYKTLNRVLKWITKADKKPRH